MGLYKTTFDVADPVHIDGDSSIRAVVTGISIYPTGVTYKVGWFNGGEARFEDFDEFRLSSATNGR